MRLVALPGGHLRFGCGQTQRPVLWVSPAWWTERINPNGIVDFADPLWAAENALRTGTADLPYTPGLTPVRRLHMAPAHQDHISRWHLERRRARSLPPQSGAATQARPQSGMEVCPPLRGSNASGGSISDEKKLAGRGS